MDPAAHANSHAADQKGGNTLTNRYSPSLFRATNRSGHPLPVRSEMRLVERVILSALFLTNKLQTTPKTGEQSQSPNFELELSESVKFAA